MARDFPRVQPVTYSFEGAKVRNMQNIAKAEHLKHTFGIAVDGINESFKKKLADNKDNPWSTMYYSEELFKLAAQHKIMSYLLNTVTHIVMRQQELNTEVILDITPEFLQHHLDANFRYTSCTERGSSGLLDAHLVHAIREFIRGSNWDMGVWWRDAQKRDVEYKLWEDEHYGHCAQKSKVDLEKKRIEREAAADAAREARRSVKRKIKNFQAMEDWKKLTDEEVLAGWPLNTNSRIWEVRQVHARVEEAQRQARQKLREEERKAQDAEYAARRKAEEDAARINEVANKP